MSAVDNLLEEEYIGWLTRFYGRDLEKMTEAQKFQVEAAFYAGAAHALKIRAQQGVEPVIAGVEGHVTRCSLILSGARKL